MRTLGFDRPLYVLPFGHRGSFVTTLFGWRGDLTPDRATEIAATKRVIHDGSKAAVTTGAPEENAGIVVDEQFGAAVLGNTARD